MVITFLSHIYPKVALPTAFEMLHTRPYHVDDRHVVM